MNAEPESRQTWRWYTQPCPNCQHELRIRIETTVNITDPKKQLKWREACEVAAESGLMTSRTLRDYRDAAR